MTTLDQAETIAVFDVDETLIPVKSMFAFLEFAMKAQMGEVVGHHSYAVFCSEIRQYRQTLPRETINRMFYRVFKGWEVTELEALVEQWWDQVPTKKRWIPETVSALRTHQHAGHPIVLLSGSADFILRPIARDLEADVTLAIKLGEMGDGSCSGEIQGIQTIGRGKRDALAQLESAFEIDARLVGYGDHQSDLDFLQYCDDAYVVVTQGNDDLAWAKGLKVLRSKSLSDGSTKVHVELLPISWTVSGVI